MYLNTIQIIGFVGKNPEQRQTQGTNAAYMVFSVATERSWKNAEGQWQKRTEWHRVVAWNRMGEQATARLRSGDHIHVEGLSAPATTSPTATAKRLSPSGRLSDRFALVPSAS